MSGECGGHLRRSQKSAPQRRLALRRQQRSSRLKPSRKCESTQFARRKSSRCKGNRAACFGKPYRRNQGTQQYSITALTDLTGTIKERYAYTAYGELTITDASGTVRSSTAEGNRYTYTGREWDDITELYHYRARMYDPLTGRFLSRDPIGYLDGYSLYPAYFGLENIDPHGNFVLSACVVWASCAVLKPFVCLSRCYENESKGVCMKRCCAARGGCRGSTVRLCSRKCDQDRTVRGGACKWDNPTDSCMDCFEKCLAAPGSETVVNVCVVAGASCVVGGICKGMMGAGAGKGPLGPWQRIRHERSIARLLLLLNVQKADVQ